MSKKEVKCKIKVRGGDMGLWDVMVFCFYLFIYGVPLGVGVMIVYAVSLSLKRGRKLEKSKEITNDIRNYYHDKNLRGVFVSPVSCCGIAITTDKIIIINQYDKKEYDLDKLMGSEIIIDNTSVSKTETNRGSQIGGAVIGTAIAGPAGMIVGGLSGSQTTTSQDYTTIIQLNVKIADFESSLHGITVLDGSDWFGGKVPSNTSYVSEIKELAGEWHAKLSTIIRDEDEKLKLLSEDRVIQKQKEMLQRSQKTGNPSSGNSPQSDHQHNVEGVGIADEIRKLSELQKQGLITEDEFNDLKKKLLSKGDQFISNPEKFKEQVNRDTEILEVAGKNIEETDISNLLIETEPERNKPARKVSRVSLGGSNFAIPIFAILLLAIVWTFFLYQRDMEGIETLNQGKELVEQKKYAEAVALLNKYKSDGNSELNKLLLKSKKLVIKSKEMKLFNEVKTIPASQWKKNRDIYFELMDLNPGKKLYRTKYDFYSKKINEVLYRTSCDDVTTSLRKVLSTTDVREGPGNSFGRLNRVYKDGEVHVGKSKNGWACLYSGSLDRYGYVPESSLGSKVITKKSPPLGSESIIKPCPPYINPYTAADPYLAGAINELNRIDAENGHCK